MRSVIQRTWPICALMIALIVIVLWNISPYNFNATAIFHMDDITAAGNVMPQDFVILNVPSYDGAQYYQVARNIPKMFTPSKWHELRAVVPGSYAYQRFLLPLTSYIVSLGQTAALPWAFLFINIFALVYSLILILKRDKSKGIYGLALTLSPAAMVAMHFTLAEPLTILLLTFFLLRYIDRQKIGMPDVAALSLLVLAREVNILFIAFLIGFSVLKMRWRDVLWLLIPVASFLALHTLIYQIFGNVPFLISAGARQLPGSAAMKLVLGMRPYSMFTFSAIALFIGFVIPGIVFTLKDIWKRRQIEVLSLGSLAFFGVMLLMPDYIWGSITSIGRVITPIYPLFIFLLMERDTKWSRTLAVIILLIGIGAAIGLATSIHPYHLVGDPVPLGDEYPF